MFKAILMSAAMALTMAACAHKTTEMSCACGKDKAACAETKECPMHSAAKDSAKSEAGCAHCKGEEKAAASK
ncbi:hypothetical protein [Bdellovibrio svalbardensis]|uniref:Lipoprotein n=1 Tax=Bdellovibrio svalbardensis TaxID=2972972 RepID=A0ABT6DQR7_9BACT|nr:hypothetical protein [Bdellovibrio svalbardensis]MDG0818254.1 hypothetical protein [Bdellovibrio svalbardensis]